LLEDMQATEPGPWPQAQIRSVCISERVKPVEGRINPAIERDIRRAIGMNVLRARYPRRGCQANKKKQQLKFAEH
jgi:hypothetical protein